LEHRYLERMGDKAADARNTVDSPGGWGLVLESFRIVVENKSEG
jgi:hypothetical protein